MKANPYHLVEYELKFFYNENDAVINFKSPHSSLCNIAMCGAPTSSDPDPHTDGMLSQVAKLRQIRHILHSLPKSITRPLQATYSYECSKNYPPEISLIFGAKTGCALFNSQTQSLIQLIQLCRKKKLSKLSPQEEIIMFKIGEETRTLYEFINKQYLQAKLLHQSYLKDYYKLKAIK